MKIISNETHDEERAYYGSVDTSFRNITIEGPLDGESAFKECKNIEVLDSKLALRYPFWHVSGGAFERLTMLETARASFWYDKEIYINNVNCDGVKAVRECKGVMIKDSTFNSIEFGWKCKNIQILNSSIDAMYAFLSSKDVKLDKVNFKGKYSFQYVKNLEINSCVLDTKDAFWHSENVTVRDSEVIGEYLGWYSKGLTLINCKIKGTQPLCYAKDLKLINCTFENCDLALENSEVSGDVTLLDEVSSIKNPLKGELLVNRTDHIIIDKFNKGSGRFSIVTKSK